MWRDARGARRDWPAARRNAERVERWIWQVLELAEQAGVDPGDAAQPSARSDETVQPSSVVHVPDKVVVLQDVAQVVDVVADLATDAELAQGHD